MAATDPPDKQGKGKSQKRRYFRRRKRRGSSARDAAYANEQDDGRDDDQRAARARPKNQNSKRSDNRRRSSRRRGAARAAAKTANIAAEEALPQTDVYIYTHVIRPAYKDAGSGDYHAEHSLNLSGATVGAALPVGMDYLLDSIGQQLDEWFSRPAGAIMPDNSAAETDEPDTVPDADRDEQAMAAFDQPEMAHESRAADEEDSPEDAALSGPKD